MNDMILFGLCLIVASGILRSIWIYKLECRIEKLEKKERTE